MQVVSMDLEIEWSAKSPRGILEIGAGAMPVVWIQEVRVEMNQTELTGGEARNIEAEETNAVVVDVAGDALHVVVGAEAEATMTTGTTMTMRRTAIEANVVVSTAVEVAGAGAAVTTNGVGMFGNDRSNT